MDATSGGLPRRLPALKRFTRHPPVAYVKFDKASSAALAMEHLNGAVLNDGRGPKLKVLLAEEPTQRCGPQRGACTGTARVWEGGLCKHRGSTGQQRRGCCRHQRGASPLLRPSAAH